MNDRYSRQIAFAPIGVTGQAKLRGSRVAIVGCGATGSVLANNLCRAGVGFLRLVDRDCVELSNLQRQLLFTEADAAAQLPKAVAAARHLSEINSEVATEPVVGELTPDNAAQLLDGVDLVLDAADNLAARYAVNDECAHRKTPWIYTGILGSAGVTMNIIPGETACFRCYLPKPPRHVATTLTEGVLNSVTAATASIASAEALKLLVGSKDFRRSMLTLDVWYNSIEYIEIARNDKCPACGGLI